MKLDTVKLPGYQDKDVKKSSNKIVEFFNKDISFGKKGLPDKIKARFFSEFSTLVGAGMDIKSALDIITEGADKKYQVIFANFTNSVVDGSSIATAMAELGLFTQYECVSIRVGEETGRLADVCAQQAGYFEKKLTQRRKFLNSISYPILVLFLAIMAVVFMVSYMVPLFQDVFNRFNADLPLLTQVVVAVSAFMREKGLLIFCLLLFLSGIVFLFRNNAAFRSLYWNLLMSFPKVNAVIAAFYSLRFYQALAMMTASRVPLLKSIQIIQEMTSMPIFIELLKNTEQKLFLGKQLNESLPVSIFFSRKELTLIKVGEEVNKLDEMFATLSRQYSEELDQKLTLLASFVEPVLIIFVGILVAIILIAMYLPMFQLSTTIS